jgi:hypothetical protein
LLRDIRSLKVGESTNLDVQPILHRFRWAQGGGYSSSCSSADSSHSTWVGTMNRVQWAGPILRRFGLRPWGVSSMLILQKGRVCFVGYYLGITNSTWEPDLDLSATAVPSGSISLLDHFQSRYSLHRRVLRCIRRFRIVVTPDATAEERENAFAFELACLATLRGCNQPSEIMPPAWKDFCEEAKRNGGSCIPAN